MPEPESPECAKLVMEAPKGRIIGAFMEWLADSGYTICETVETTSWGQNPHVPVRKNIEQLLAAYFEIDLNKVEDERRAIIDYWRVRSAEIEARVEKIDAAIARSS